jgi:hypothetical protein
VMLTLMILGLISSASAQFMSVGDLDMASRGEAPVRAYASKDACEKSEKQDCVELKDCSADECKVETVNGKKELVRDPLLKKDKDDKKLARERKRQDRKARLINGCKTTADVLLKDLCDEVLNSEP